MKVFVIIPTYNRAKDLEELLKCLSKQTEKPNVIIVADQSKEEITKINGENCRKYNAVYLYVKDLPSLARTRNFAINYLLNNFDISNEDLIVFLDDDVLLPKDFIKRIKEYTKKIKDFSIIGPIPSNFIYSWLKKNIFRKAISLLLGLIGCYGSSLIKNSLNRMFYNQWIRIIKFTEADWVSGCCLVIKARIIKKIKFDENLLRWSFMEDLDFCFRARRYGKIYLIPIIIIHKISEEARLSSKKVTLMRIIYPYYLLKKNVKNKACFYLRKIYDFLFIVKGIPFLPIYKILRKRYDIKSVVMTLKVLKIIKWKNVKKILKNFNEKILLKKP